MQTPFDKKLSQALAKLDVVELAKFLLGKTLITEITTVKKGKTEILRTGGIITEVEAYSATNDLASHSARGKTPRSEVMFQSAGTVYVYFIYGVHYCVNIVAGDEEHGDAVLIRAIEPTIGIGTMQQRRNLIKNTNKKKFNTLLTGGPGKLCQALGIDRTFNTLHILSQPQSQTHKIFVEEGIAVKETDILASTRIGITKSKELEWRFTIEPNAS